MATVTKPIALDESLNTTELVPRNVADVLAEELGAIATAVSRIATPTTVEWTQIQQSGTKIAEIRINGSTTNVYAPSGGGGFSALLVITANSGETITATKGGDSYTATEVSSGTYEVTVDSAGTWTVSDGVNSTTVAVSASTTYYVTLSSIPDGSTVTPTDDVQLLLNCADIWDKAYTTIGELLADSTTLALVIADNNAIDYLVRSTTWASSVCADSTAMTDIGLSNYASDTLLADSTWCNAICNSTYFESVLNVKVPSMTSATTPSGEVFASGYFGSFYPYLAFDGDVNTPWQGSTGASGDGNGEYVGYKFTSAKKVKCLNMKGYGYNAPADLFYIKVQGSNDNATWNDLTGAIQYQNSIEKKTPISSNNTNYLYYRVIALNSSITTLGEYVVQFYGREDI